MLGYTKQTEITPGNYEDVITERPALGTVEQRTEVVGLVDQVLPQYRTTTSISVLSQGVEKTEYGDLAYISFKGRNWVPSSIVEDPPKIKIFIGQEYHGPTPD